MTEPIDSERPRAYVIYGMHGGYFLTHRSDFDTCVGYIEDCLKQRPGVVYSMEIEAYTLDRLVRGPQLDVEKRHYSWSRETDPDAWLGEALAARFRNAAATGRIDNVSTYTQPILHALDGEAVIRQFAYARRIQREVLGIELDHYGAQEPCWCGQVPAILNGFNMKGCLYETSWGPAGFAPLRNGEMFRWRGPDGSEIATVAANPGMRDPGLERDKEVNRHFKNWANATWWTLNRRTINRARELGLDNPAQLCLALDFTRDNDRRWFDIADFADDDCDIRFVTLGQYLEVARDDGAWEDAFAEFEDRLCWGLHGGGLYLESQRAANRTILTQRLSVLQGYDHRNEEDLMWQATMVAHHHDPWLVPRQCFGNWDYDKYEDLIAACRKEVDTRADALFPAAETAPFQVTNPTQHTRREWLAVALALPEGDMAGVPAVVDATGRSVPCRLQTVSRHTDGSADRVEGYMLAEVAGFRSASYEVRETDSEAGLPTRVVRSDAGWELANDTLRATVATDGIRLYRNNVEVVSDLFLHAKVEGWDDRSRITDVRAGLASSGIAEATVKGVVGCIPFELDLSLKPWSDRFDIRVRCDYNGETTEGTNYWEQDGNLKLVARYPRPVTTLLHHPLELRPPSDKTHSAVHFVMADADDGSGCVIVLDRPSGVVSGADSTGIALCHSGWVLYSPSSRPGVAGIDAERYGTGRVYGVQSYDASIVPYGADDRARAPCAYQAQAYPLHVGIPSAGPLPLPAIDISGHSVVSNLSREAHGIVLRFWNPFAAETVVVRAPGMRLVLVDLENREIERIGQDEASIEIGTMQIRSVLIEDVLTWEELESINAMSDRRQEEAEGAHR